MIRPLESKVALVTGAGRGIGRAVALELARAGCSLSLLSRTRTQLDSTRSECERLGVRALCVPGDIADRDHLEVAVSRTVAELGSLAILINNAGVFYYERIQAADPDAWDRSMDVNLRALMHLTRLALPELTRSSGAIVNIASNASKTAYAGGAAYCATKHGVLGFARSVFHDVRDAGVRVSTICPHFVNTSMVTRTGLDRERMIQPQDIARTVLFVVTFPAHACPTEIDIYPQRDPRESSS